MAEGVWGVYPDVGVGVEGEDRPQQDVAKLDVAEAAPIEHHHHAHPADLLLHQHQQQQTDTVQVRVAAPAAEVDPLHDGHPADLEPALDTSGAAPRRARTVGLATAQGQLDSALNGPVQPGDPVAKNSGVSGPMHGGGQRYMQCDVHMTHASQEGWGAASMMNGDDVSGSPGGDSPLVDVLDPVNAYVKVQGGSGWPDSTSAGAQAEQQTVIMGSDVQSKQASPPDASQLGKQSSLEHTSNCRHISKLLHE